MRFIYGALLLSLLSLNLMTLGCSKDRPGGRGSVGVSPGPPPQTFVCPDSAYYHPEFGWLDEDGSPIDCHDDYGWWHDSHHPIDLELYYFTGRTCHRGQSLGPDCRCELYFGSMNGYVYCRNTDQSKK